MRTSFAVATVLGAFAAAQQTVQVGDASGTQFTFTPSTITAKAGETINFQFGLPIHTVTQAASVDTPCVQAGFSSAVGASTYSVTVNGTDPIFIFCGPHCTAGMVMIINPAATADVTTFANIAQGKTTPSSSSAPAASGGSSAAAPSSSSTAPASTGAASATTPSLFGALAGLVLAALV